jgi:hypothetical protein
VTPKSQTFTTCQTKSCISYRTPCCLIYSLLMWYCILVAGLVGHVDNHHKTQQKVLQRTKSVHWYQLVANISSPNVVSLDCILTSESLPKKNNSPLCIASRQVSFIYLPPQRNSVEPTDNKFHAQCLWENKNLCQKKWFGNAPFKWSLLALIQGAC